MFNTGNVKLNISFPFGKTLALSAVFIILIASLMELAARSPYARSKVPIQAYGINHMQFEVQYQILENYVQNNGAPKCIIMGNSMAHRSINPIIISQRVKEITGKNLDCFNFSITAANVAVSAMFSKILVERYHPKLLIIGTSFLDYSEGREGRIDQRFFESPWMEYLSGEYNWEGWLLDHSYAFRLINFFSYSTNQSQTLDEIYQEIQKFSRKINLSGYFNATQIFAIENPVKQSVIDRLLSELNFFNISQWNIENLELFAEYKNQGIEVIFIDMPFHSTFIELVDSDGNPIKERDFVVDFVNHANEQIANIAKQYGIIFFSSSNLELIPDDGWSDRYHLNKIGSSIFSVWMVDQILMAVEDGDINSEILGNQ